MIVTESTKSILRYRRAVKRWRSEGYEELRPSLHFANGQRVIVDVQIAPGGHTLYVKMGPAPGFALAPVLAPNHVAFTESDSSDKQLMS